MALITGTSTRPLLLSSTTLVATFFANKVARLSSTIFSWSPASCRLNQAVLIRRTSFSSHSAGRETPLFEPVLIFPLLLMSSIRRSTNCTVLLSAFFPPPLETLRSLLATFSLCPPLRRLPPPPPAPSFIFQSLSAIEGPYLFFFLGRFCNTTLSPSSPCPVHVKKGRILNPGSLFLGPQILRPDSSLEKLSAFPRYCFDVLLPVAIFPFRRRWWPLHPWECLAYGCQRELLCSLEIFPHLDSHWFHFFRHARQDPFYDRSREA